MPEPSDSLAWTGNPAVAQPNLAAEKAQPLDEFYARNGVALPPLDYIEGFEIPEPYRSLLVHDNDMTSTLESFHGGPLVLGVLGRKRIGQEYYREVVLLMAGTAKPVEFGAIRLHLNRFPEVVRHQILEEYYPLGRILKENELYFTSQPKAFLRMASDQLINDILRLSGAHVLYGRRNILSDPAGRVLAEIVEVLPPHEESSSRSKLEP